MHPTYSAETYILEPPELWTSTIEDKFKQLAPRVVTLDGIKQWVVKNNQPFIVAGDIEEQVVYRDYLDASSYIEKLDRQGIAGAVLYPTIAKRAYEHLETELLSEVARIYNNWIIEFCNAYPNRLKAVTMLNVDRPEEAVAELERTVKMGAAGVMIPLFSHTKERYDNPKYELLWRTAQRLNVPISLVAGTLRAVHKLIPGSQVDHLHYLFDLLQMDINDNDLLYRFTFQACEAIYPRIALSAMILSGVFNRYPALNVITVGFGATWVPHFMARIDEMDDVRPERSGSELFNSTVKEENSRFGLQLEQKGFDLSQEGKPSSYFHRNIYMTLQDDLNRDYLKKIVSGEHLLCGSDYPHQPSSSPNSAELIEKQAKQILNQEYEQISGGNTASLYQFSTN